MKPKLQHSLNTLIVAGLVSIAANSTAADLPQAVVEKSYQPITYTVKQGDTLRSIAAQFELTDNNALQ